MNRNLHDTTVATRLRERALASGPASLSTPELLVLLASGLPASRRRRSRAQAPRFAVQEALPLAYHEVEPAAIAAAQGLIDEAGHLRNVIHSPDVPAEIRLLLRAAIEVSARVVEPGTGEILSSPGDAREFLTRWIGHEQREMFCGVFLDTQHRVLAKEVMFQGTIDSAFVDPRHVVRRAVVLGAAAMLVAHQHPSTNPEPSSADIHLTRELKEKMSAVGIRLLDHIVVGGSTTVSLAERGLV